jgi:hypothetical protein
MIYLGGTDCARWEARKATTLIGVIHKNSKGNTENIQKEWRHLTLWSLAF